MAHSASCYNCNDAQAASTDGSFSELLQLDHKRGKLLHQSEHIGTANNVWIAKQVSLVHVITLI